MPTLLLVESPNKAKKIQGFLGGDVKVRASVGHICDLPERGYGVDLATFEESYEVRNPKVVGELRQLVRSKAFDRVLLATDPDREGEAIAWHLARELRLGAQAPLRVEFREVTAAAVRAAMGRPRPIDLARVDAQRARRVLDRVVGFDVSQEICWPAGATSAGRVQTPALHLLCEREREILAFVPETYWTLGVTYAEGFGAFVPEERKGSGVSGLGSGADSEVSDDGVPHSETPDPRPQTQLRAKRFPTREEADAARALAAAHPHVVRDVDRRRTERRPEPPYTTSTMQQDASRKLRLSAKQAADQAQALFEAGYITYHRTDSPRVSEDAVAMAREHIAAVRPDALPARPPASRTKAGAQDAHEAIRPTKLAGDDAPPPGTERLYALIKARFLASQSKPAVIDRTTVHVDSGPVAWVAQGAVVVDPGFLHFWQPYAKQEDEPLPVVTVGQVLTPTDYQVEQKQTQPPSRYDTGALIRKLEVSGIGRPATFASIIETLLRRTYVQELKAGRGKVFLQPTEFGLQVDGLLTDAFPELVSERYTADMESELDAIERGGGETRVGYLTRWHGAFRRAMHDALPRAARYRLEHGLTARAARGGGARGEETAVRCDRCGEATYTKIARRVGKGSFLACPACRMTRDVRARTKPNGCPRCGSTLIERSAKKSKSKFFGCVRYGAAERPCEYAEWSDSARETGPRGAGTGAPGTTPSVPAAERPATAEAIGDAPPRRTSKRATGKTATKPATKPATKRAVVKRAAANRSAATRGARSGEGPVAAAEGSASAPSRAAREGTEKPCPKCERTRLDVVRPADPAAAPFYACPDVACRFTLTVGARRRAAPCPSCGGVVLERRRRDGGAPFWACAKYPDCRYAAEAGRPA